MEEGYFGCISCDVLERHIKILEVKLEEALSEVRELRETVQDFEYGALVELESKGEHHRE